MAIPQCALCGLQGVELFKCACCRAAQYCGRRCQKTHWRVHKPMCGMVKAGQVSSTIFRRYSATEPGEAQQGRLQTIQHDNDQDSIFASMKIAPSENELREQITKSKAECRMYQRQGENYDAARCMHDCALWYLRAEWWLEASEAIDECKKLLLSHKVQQSTAEASDQLSDYNTLQHAVYANAVMIACRLNPSKQRERVARHSIIDKMKRLSAMEPNSHSRISQIRALHAIIEAECVLLQETESWGAYVEMHKRLVLLTYEIYSEDEVPSITFVLSLEQLMTRMASILSTHKDLFEASTYAQHIQFVADLRPRLVEDAPRPVAAKKGSVDASRAASR